MIYSFHYPFHEETANFLKVGIADNVLGTYTGTLVVMYNLQDMGPGFQNLVRGSLS